MNVSFPKSSALGLNGSAPHAQPRTQTFRAARRVDGRVLLGLGAGTLSLLLLAVGLRQVVPESQSLLVATHDLDRGAVVRADALASVEVRAPADLVRASFSSGSTDAIIGKQ